MGLGAAAATTTLCIYWACCAFWGILALFEWIQLSNGNLSGTADVRPEELEVLRRVEPEESRCINLTNVLLWLVGVLILLPLRVGMLCLLAVLQIGLCVAIQVCCPSDPLQDPQHECNSVAQCLGHMGSRAIIRLALLVFGVISIEDHPAAGRETLPPERRGEITQLIVSNHVSALDVLYFMQRLFPSFVAKHSLAQSPLVGRCAKLMRCVFVDRASEAARERTVSLIGERSKALRKSARRRSHGRATQTCVPPLVIFAEGTTSAGRAVLPLKRGAFAPLETVTPVVLVYSCVHINISFEIVSYWSWLALVLISAGPVTLKVYWLPDVEAPIHGSPETRLAKFRRLVIPQKSTDADSSNSSRSSGVQVWRRMTDVLSAESDHFSSVELPEDWDDALRVKRLLQQEAAKHHPLGRLKEG